MANEAIKCTYAKAEQNQHRKHSKKNIRNSDNFAVDVRRFIGGFGGRVEMSLCATLGRLYVVTRYFSRVTLRHAVWGRR